MSIKKHREWWQRNRDIARRQRKGCIVCFHCDKGGCAPGGKCNNCGYDYGRRWQKVDKKRLPPMSDT